MSVDILVVLVDFYLHGKSSGLYPPHVMSVDILVQQVREVVIRLGWEDEPLVFGGVSLGGAVSTKTNRSFSGG
ncbi:hypothetical protein T484DRAFT_1770254 [Baffinella frigidus]|nr:hypothetical protein T484DRAFT_1770254 [Cryptophyta sp. CCMP2293]